MFGNIIGLSMKSQEIECFYKSFEGSGSLYIGKEPSLKSLELLSKYTIRAIVIICKSIKGSYPNNFEVLHLLPQERDASQLKDNFDSSFNFIDKHRSKSNILICSSQGSNLAIPLILGYLMKKYRYDLEYVCRLFQQNLKALNIPEEYIQHLRRISVQFQKDKEQEDQEELLNNTLGKRIIRIRKDYSNIADGSRFRSLPKRAYLKANPEFSSIKKGTPSKQLNPLQLKLQTVTKRLSNFEDRLC